MKEKIKKAVVDYIGNGRYPRHVVGDCVFDGDVRVTYVGFKNASYNFGDRKPLRYCFRVTKDGKGVGVGNFDVNYNAGVDDDDYWNYVLREIDL